MPSLEARLAVLESQVEALQQRPRFFFVLGNADPAASKLAEADITGFRAGAVQVGRLPGESLADLEARCAASDPATVAWFATYP